MLTHRITCLDCGRIAVTELKLDKCPYCSSSKIQKESSKRSDSPLKAVYFDKLNSDQQKIVLSTEGVNYVNAGPGTAKSTTLAARAKYIALARRDNLHHPIILTFTKEAANHITNILSLSKQDMPQVSTIHSFAYRRITKHAHTSEQFFDFRFRIMSQDEKREILQHIQKLLPQYSWEELAGKITLYKRKHKYIDSLLTDMSHSDPLLDLYLKEQRDRELYDFDDLVNLLAFMIENDDDIGDAIREECQYVLVDEAQDLTAAELKLLKLITAKYRNLFLVGDEDQSIYSWRGAANHILEWLKTLETPCNYFTLTTNYRSTPSIIHTANTLIQNNPSRKSKEIISYKPQGVKVLIRECETAHQEAKMIAAAIELATDEKSLPVALKYKDIAVLARTHTQLELIKRQLIRKKIPVELTGIPLLKSKESMTVFRYLVFLDRTDYYNFALLEEEAVREEDHLEFINDYVLANGSVFKGLNQWYSEGKFLTAQGKLLLDWMNNNIHTSSNKAVKAILEYKNMDPADPVIKALLVRWKKYLKNNISVEVLVNDWRLAVYEENNMRVDGNFVRLETIHSAKGKEYKKVFLCGVTDGVLPDHDGVLEEERRLFYVGITRAMKELTISYPVCRYGKPFSASPFIEDIRHCPDVIFSEMEAKSVRQKKSKKLPNTY